MLRISSAKIKDIVSDIDMQVIEGIVYKKTGDPMGLIATFSHDAEDEELAKMVIKKYLKSKFPVLRVFVEII